MTDRDPPSRFDGEPVKFEEFRAPRGHLKSITRPTLKDAGTLIDSNRRVSKTFPGILSDLRDAARIELLGAARKYTSAYRDISDFPTTIDRVVMAGHQPTLFHPGVWFKNFALHQIASLQGAVAVNLVVDSDVAGPGSIRVPHRGANGLGYEAVAYDERGGGVPYEQTLVRDLDFFSGFDARVKRAVSGVIDDPLVSRLWQFGREAIQRCGYAGCALAQARHRLEADFGLKTLEVPQSVVCRSESFSQFAMILLADLPRFHRCYNDAAEFYRQVHGIRSSAHPVPNLGRDGDWFETPFWVYGNASPQRRSLWVRRTHSGRTLELSDRENRHRRIDVVEGSDSGEAFAALSSPEFKIRSRALVTTMYARLVLSDLFLHGIGGGKYDQLGDLITRSFWGVQPPRMQVISATVLLPGHQLTGLAEIDQELAALVRRRRDLQWQPERFAAEVGLPQQALDQKAALLNAIPPRGQRSAWHSRISEVNRNLSAELGSLSDAIDRRRSELLDQRKAAGVMQSREHSFCVFPEEYLRRAFGEMLDAEGAAADLGV